MRSRTFATDDLRQLTDVQLTHRVNDAMTAREADATPPSRGSILLRRAEVRHPLWYGSVAFTAQLWHALHGSLLAVTLASEARLGRWAERSQKRMTTLLVDIAILTMLDEMERRVGLRSIAAATDRAARRA
jgi:hypothetical protein